MSYLEIYYNPSSKDWDAAADAALSRIDFTPDTIICLPLESGSQLNLFNEQKQGRKNEEK
jgi:hypothetical protein